MQRESEISEISMVMNGFDNLLRSGDHWQKVMQLEFFLRKRVQKLCRGTVSTAKNISFYLILTSFQYERPAHLDKDLKCTWLDHNNPYLRMGPFKYELLHEDPQIASIHDMVSKNESFRMREIARGRMKSTPYAQGHKESTYSKLR